MQQLVPDTVERVIPQSRESALVVGDVAFILLANDKGVAVIDADFAYDYGRRLWVKSGKNYASTSVKGKIVYMHRMLTDAPPGTDVDHLNHDTLDNRLCNLRVVSKQENHRNRGADKGCSSQFKGVSWICRDKRWMASIAVDRKTRNVGYFKSEIEAARAYDRKAVELGWPPFGLNFPENYEKYLTEVSE